MKSKVREIETSGLTIPHGQLERGKEEAAVASS